MAKPALLILDDDAQVLRAVERDLRREYNEHYRILRGDSGLKGLETLAQLKERGETVASF
jgi:thioredoxin reductase (NADPH)